MNTLILRQQEKDANDNYVGIIQCRANIEANFITLARLLTENLENAYWKMLGHDSFESFIASPEIGFSRSKVYGLIQIYRLYVKQLNVSSSDLVEVGTTNLLLIAPVVERDKDGWIAKAKTLSKSDLKAELGTGGGPPTKPPIASPKNICPPSPDSCCNCGSKEWEKHHFPITRGAGGEEVEDWWIPLCRKCHQEYHNGPKEWTWVNRRNWARYLYGKAVKVLADGK